MPSQIHLLALTVLPLPIELTTPGDVRTLFSSLDLFDSSNIQIHELNTLSSDYHIRYAYVEVSRWHDTDIAEDFKRSIRAFGPRGKSINIEISGREFHDTDGNPLPEIRVIPNGENHFVAVERLENENSQLATANKKLADELNYSKFVLTSCLIICVSMLYSCEWNFVWRCWPIMLYGLLLCGTIYK